MHKGLIVLSVLSMSGFGIYLPTHFFFQPHLKDQSEDFYEDGTNGLCCRYSIWHGDRQSPAICPNRTIRYMCHLSYPELSMVYAKENTCIFANKFSLKVAGGPDAIKCIHHHIVEQTAWNLELFIDGAEVPWGQRPRKNTSLLSSLILPVHLFGSSKYEKQIWFFLMLLCYMLYSHNQHM